MKKIRGCEIKQIEIANDFYEAYKRCSAANDKNQIVAIPAFVNGFFACELYLKSILSANNINTPKNSSGHNIEKIFNLLPTELKNTIKEKFSNEAKSIDGLNSVEFNELLNKMSFGFEFWRYIYEDKNKQFEKDYPFAYSEKFLSLFLPIIEDKANKYVNLKKSGNA